jgi:hypothetical protein
VSLILKRASVSRRSGVTTMMTCSPMVSDHEGGRRTGGDIVDVDAGLWAS